MPVSVEVLDLAECHLRAMGTDVHVLVLDGDDADLHWAHGEIERLEARWSRFLDPSDVSRVTRHAGSWVEVAPETVDLLQAAIEAWRTTDGAFDPLLGAPLSTLGYDRSFELVDPGGAGATAPLPPAVRGEGDLEVDVARGRARVAPGRVLDLGGLAKGWTADLLVAGLLDRGASGACANLGGDVAVGGRSPQDDGWYLAVEHLAATSPLGMLAVRAGGVATSTALRRRWAGPRGDGRHHLLDPRRGTPCRGAVLEVTAVAGSAARAEVLTKVAFVAPEQLAASLRPREAALLTDGDGVTRAVGDLAVLQPVGEAVLDAG